MIKIRESPTADTRTCDFKNVTENQLADSTRRHIGDVQAGMIMLAGRLLKAAARHDRTKLSHLHEFWTDFVTGFKTTTWWEMHQKEERHHFNSSEYVRDDVNLIDVLEQIVDGVMASLARSGQYRSEPVPNALLQAAYANTAKMLIDSVEVLTGEGAKNFERGGADAGQDQYEKVPFASVGGLKSRRNMRVPHDIPAEHAENYLAGYRRAAMEMYGFGWEDAEFGWHPAITLDAPTPT